MVVDSDKTTAAHWVGNWDKQMASDSDVTSVGRTAASKEALTVVNEAWSWAGSKVTTMAVCSAAYLGDSKVVSWDPMLAG